MKLLVTGGAGFIGSNFIHYWLKTHPDDQIVNLDKLTYAGNPDNLKNVASSSQYKFIKGDIGDIDAANLALQKVDTVVNFAAESHVDRSILGPGIFLMTNVIGTQVLLEASLEHQLKLFIHVSTDEVFGDLPFDRPRTFLSTNVLMLLSPLNIQNISSAELLKYNCFVVRAGKPSLKSQNN